MRNRLVFGLLLGVVLSGCGGSGTANSSNQQLTFLMPAAASVPTGTANIQVAVVNSAGNPAGKATANLGAGNPVITFLPSGPVVVNAYAVSASGVLLASGRTTTTLSNGSNSTTVNFSPVPPPVTNQQYVLSGTVCTNPDTHASGRISLHAIIDENSDLAQTAYTQTNFRVFEDGIELTPFTAAHANTVARAREDICFILDSSATESAELQGVANSISNFAAQLASQDQNVQFGGVSFAENVRSQIGLTPSVANFQSWVQSLTPSGGDGLADNPLDAIQAALSFKWRMDSQHILIVVTSMPMHQAGDGSGVTNQTVQLIQQAIRSGFVVDSICPTSTPAIAHANSANAVNPDRHIQYLQVSTLSQIVGGMSIALPTDGNVDLSALNIPALIYAGYVFSIPSSLHTPNVAHTVRILLSDNAANPLADINLAGTY